MTEVSVVVPVYRVGKYLDECLESILALPCPKEVILVDDGDPEQGADRVFGSLGAEEQKSVRVIHQENQGLGGARNTGLLAATGVYVWFVDSDDWIEPMVWGPIQQSIKAHHPDILGLSFVACRGNHRQVMSPMPSGVMKGSRAFGRIHPAAWSRVYRREYLLALNHPFPPGRYEDLAVLPFHVCPAHKYIQVDAVGYYYRIRQESIMTTVDERSKDIFTAVQHMASYRPKNILEVLAQTRLIRDQALVWTNTWGSIQSNWAAGFLQEWKPLIKVLLKRRRTFLLLLTTMEHAENVKNWMQRAFRAVARRLLRLRNHA